MIRHRSFSSTIQHADALIAGAIGKRNEALSHRFLWSRSLAVRPDD